jgi:IS1 family transposase
MNKLSADKQAAILRALVEGNSIRATCRITGAAKGTVSSLLKIVGAHCKNHHDRFVRDVETKRVQCDEIWSFSGKKQKRVKQGETGCGDVWTWTALDSDTKLMIGYLVADRSADAAHEFMEDLAERIIGRCQLTTDGLALYLPAVERAFGWARVDYAMMIKNYSAPKAEKEAARRYSPSEVVSIEKKWVMGKPDMAHVSTSHVERQNLTMRMGMRRFTRLTNAFSKKVEFHLYAVALHFTYYNYCRVHTTLTKANRGIHTTPAMAAGLTDRVWTVYDILNLLHGN